MYWMRSGATVCHYLNSCMFWFKTCAKLVFQKKQNAVDIWLMKKLHAWNNFHPLSGYF